MPRMNSSESLCFERDDYSMGEFSMASEDAVVLMINILEDANDDDNGNKKRVMEEKVCGSVNIQMAAHQ